MISGLTLALAHLAMLLALLGAATVSAHRARNGVRFGRSGRYRRLSTPQMLRRLERQAARRTPQAGRSLPGDHGMRGKYSPSEL